ncbi:hypothetical protein Halru_1046 [Halovivax ruber XH-70]|uniref:eCIS core domain-containing protein n=2 Tax=Halovivax ruber TaxID=387341 RepID=L0IAA3_HALRX|nr:hypothetical protein Halru_1046 [Halovivax ruber XH-70]
MGMPDAPIPDAPIPDATPPDATPSVGLPAMENVNPIPQTDRVSMASRGYGHEAQEHIMRATEGTETNPHDVPDPVLDVLAIGTGKSLDASLQRALEARMDADFSNVQVHTGPEAAKATDAIDARAFTCGNAIVFNDGEYDPESAEGQYLLAHELAHVKQQTGAAISMMPQSDADLEIDPDPQLEREADRAAEEALSGEEPLIVNRLGTDVHIQRKDWNAGLANAERLSTAEGPGPVGGTVDDLTTKTYRLTQDELVDLVESVDAPDELPAYVEANDIDVSSRLQDTMGGGFKGATSGWKAGSMAGSLAGPAGALAGGLAAMPVGYFIAQQYGNGTADTIQKRLRSLLGLTTEQEFENEQEKQDKSVWFSSLRG